MSKTTSYGPDPILVSLWALVCSLPAFVTGYLASKVPSSANLVQFAWTLLLPVLVVVFARRFKATFAPAEFIYRRWGPTVRVSYAEIERIEVANITPLTKQAVGAFVITKHGHRLPFWPKLFPQEAVDRFFGLAR